MKEEGKHHPSSKGPRLSVESEATEGQRAAGHSPALRPALRSEIMEAMGEAAYIAYCEHQEWRSFKGDALPTWRAVRE